MTRTSSISVSVSDGATIVKEEIVICLTHEERDALKHAVKTRYLEYRGYGTENDPLDETDVVRYSTASYLENLGFLRRDDMAWHETFKPTEKGRHVIEKLP